MSVTKVTNELIYGEWNRTAKWDDPAHPLHISASPETPLRLSPQTDAQSFSVLPFAHADDIRVFEADAQWLRPVPSSVFSRQVFSR